MADAYFSSFFAVMPTAVLEKPFLYHHDSQESSTFRTCFGSEDNSFYECYNQCLLPFSYWLFYK